MIYLKLVLTMVFWGGTFVAGRQLAGQMGPFSAAFLRFAIATACLLAFVRAREGGLPRLDRRALLGVLLLGATGVFAYNALFFTGLKTVGAGRAAVIIAGNPILIALGAALFFGEGFTPRKAAGIALSVAGAAEVIGRGDPLSLLNQGLSPGDAAILGCVASWVSYSLLGKAVMTRISPLAAVTWSSLAGTLLLLPPALAEGIAPTAYPLSAWAGLAYLGVCGTVLGFTWFYEGIRAVGASRAGVFINLVPVSAVILAFLLLGEPVDRSLLLGGALVLAGVWLTNTSRKAA
ncbi:MAG: DMT family transporter [Thermodesulfobacteriota bacterium]